MIDTMNVGPKLGEADAAAKDLELLVSRYAQTDQVQVAKKMLSELKAPAR